MTDPQLARAVLRCKELDKLHFQYSQLYPVSFASTTPLLMQTPLIFAVWHVHAVHMRIMHTAIW